MQKSRRGDGNLYVCALYVKDLYPSHLCAADQYGVVVAPCSIGRQAYGNLFGQGRRLMEWSREMVRVAPPHDDSEVNEARGWHDSQGAQWRLPEYGNVWRTLEEVRLVGEVSGSFVGTRGGGGAPGTEERCKGVPAVTDLAR